MKATPASPPGREESSDIAAPRSKIELSSQPDVYHDSCLHIEHSRYFFTVKGTRLALSRTEFRILSRLIRGINRIVSFDDIWSYAWQRNKAFKLKSVHVFVSRVRRKLEPFGIRINSVVGVGYILSHDSCCRSDTQEGD
jgi:DNA-binding response OmpR family regulator